ncbi:hypothetical protein ASD03_35490 [Ensifer sp. Root127]|nr:hypothetical protein ASD03_35490 [Ensifer sp. Root127]
MQQMLTRGLRDNTAGTFQNSRALILSASLVMRSMLMKNCHDQCGRALARQAEDVVMFATRHP